MSLTMYDLTIPTMLRGFDVLSSYLDKAEAFSRQKGLDPSDLVQARLAPDMLPFGGQIQRASDKAKGGVARLTGLDAPKFADTESTFAELTARITKTTDFLRAINPKRFEGAEHRSVELASPALNGTFRGDHYLMNILLPDFFFHVTMAHGILRHRGVSIGKSDYLGRLPQEKS
jgi:hypothetical protein